LGVDLSPPDSVTSADDERPKTVASANFLAALTKTYDETFRLGYNRKRRYQEYDVMDKGEIAAQLDDIRNATLISDDGTMPSFDVRAKGAKYQTIVDDVMEDTNIHKKIRAILRGGVKYGDGFVEFIIDENYNVVGVQSAPCDTMYVGVDKHNRLLPGAEVIQVEPGRTMSVPRAYRQLNPAMKIVAAWYPWEMAHIKWEPSDEHIYSASSYLEPLRYSWHMLNMMENGMAVARLVRAYMQKVHKVDITGKTNEEAENDIKAYQRTIAQHKLSGGSVVDRPFGVDEDLFLGVRYHTQQDGSLVPSLNDIDAIDPRNAGLSQIDDMLYNREKLFTYIPAEVVGMEGDRSRDLSRQDVAVSRLYQYCQRNVLEEQLLWPMFRLALLLKGYTPKREDIEVVWPDVMVKFSWRHSDAFFRRMMGHANAIEAGIITPDYVRRTEYGMSQEESDEMEQAVIAWGRVKPDLGGAAQANQTRVGNRSA
jgi:hypothetical protein